MRRAMVAIGVDKTAAGFPPLNAARTGASQMAAWAGQQGFDVALLPADPLGSVTLTDVFNAVTAYVDARVYDQLVVYFSGHGILLSPDTEAWLLSGALTNPNEAVNVSGSIVAARSCGIEHVVFISDACRSMPSNFRMGQVSPGVIFPPRTPKAPMPEVDVFYATLPGDPALEVPPDEAEKAFRGLLTHCMLGALRGMPSSLVESVSDAGHPLRVVASRPLKRHLVTAVPDAATAVAIKLRQFPDVRVESALPKYLALIADAAPPVGRDHPGPPLDTPRTGSAPVAMDATLEVPLLNTVAAFAQSFRVNDPDRGMAGPLQLDPLPELAGIRDSVDRIVKSVGRDSFETRTGFTVHGIGVQFARATGVDVELLDEGDATSIRIWADYQPGQRAAPRLLLLQFENGDGMALPVLPGYIGAVIVEGGRVVTVNYTPSRGTQNYEEFKYAASEIEQRRALVAVAARNGAFRLADKEATATALYLRYQKRADPTLGLFAAYAYAQVGHDRGVLSVHDVMRWEPEPLLFDVAMLAAQRNPALPQTLDFSPWMPLLTQGWMLLGKFEAELPEVLARAKQHLLPALWTTFAADGMAILKQHIFEVQ